MPRTPILTSHGPRRQRRPWRAAVAALLVSVLGAGAAALLLGAFGGGPASDRARTAAKPRVRRVAAPPWLVARGVGTLGSPRPPPWPLWTPIGPSCSEACPGGRVPEPGHLPARRHGRGPRRVAGSAARRRCRGARRSGLPLRRRGHRLDRPDTAGRRPGRGRVAGGAPAPAAIGSRKRGGRRHRLPRGWLHGHACIDHDPGVATRCLRRVSWPGSPAPCATARWRPSAVGSLSRAAPTAHHSRRDVYVFDTHTRPCDAWAACPCH